MTEYTQMVETVNCKNCGVLLTNRCNSQEDSCKIGACKEDWEVHCQAVLWPPRSLEAWEQLFWGYSSP